MVQARDRPDAQSVMENDDAEVPSVLFLSTQAQVFENPNKWTLVTAGEEVRGKSNLRRSMPENYAAEVASLILQVPVSLLLVRAQVRGR